MNKVKFILFMLLCAFFSNFYVNASCTDEELSNLKLEANKIKITYRHLEDTLDDDGVNYNSFEIIVKNVNDDLYISLFNGTIILKPVNGEIKEVFNNGTWNFEIYSNKCESKIDEIEVHIPRFNAYSLDPLCEGVDGNDFALCGKYYEYDVSYDSFKERVTYYRTIHNIGTSNADEIDSGNDTDIFENLLNLLIKYKMYLLIALVIIIMLIVIILIIYRRRERGILK